METSTNSVVRDAVSRVVAPAAMQAITLESAQRCSRLGDRLEEVRAALSMILADEAAIQATEKAFLDIARTAYLQRPVDLKERDVQYMDNGGGMERDVTYVMYVDQFASVDGRADFDTLAEAIPYLQCLGVTKVYLLPFLDSPMQDAGFDVKDYRNVREELGGVPAFERFAARARAAGMTIQMDIVFNHVSDQHVWAEKLLAGDLSYKDYFIVLEHEPEILAQEDGEQGTFITYREIYQGVQRTVTRRLIFAGLEKSHYRRIEVTGKPYWVLHTFYSNQWDVNVANPAVLIEFMDVLGFWANRGVKTFRMDAVPFLVKTGESEPGTLAFVELMNRFLHLVAPSSNLLVEAAQKPDVIRRYFGHPVRFDHPFVQRQFSTTSAAQMAYGFTAMPYMWASLLTGDNHYFQEGMRQTGDAPEGAAWNFFLRNHDELTLEMVEAEVGRLIFDGISDKGYPFRNGLGVGGRMASFLGMCPQRIHLAHAMLLSLKGEISLYFGDELAMANNHDHMLEAAGRRGGIVDSRDAGRGKICVSFTRNAMAASGDEKTLQVFCRVKRLIEVMKQRPSLMSGDFTMLRSSNNHVLAYERSHQAEQTIIVLNLSSEPQTTSLGLATFGAHGWQDLLSNQDVEARLGEGGVTLTLAPFQALWLTAK